MQPNFTAWKCLCGLLPAVVGFVGTVSHPRSDDGSEHSLQALSVNSRVLVRGVEYRAADYLASRGLQECIAMAQCLLALDDFRFASVTSAGFDVLGANTGVIDDIATSDIARLYAALCDSACPLSTTHSVGLPKGMSTLLFDGAFS